MNDALKCFKRVVNVTDDATEMIKLPCIKSADKRGRCDEKVAYYTLYFIAMEDDCNWQFAEVGDYLCEKQDGKWVLLKARKI